MVRAASACLPFASLKVSLRAMHHYNVVLVFLSYTVSVLGSFTALQLIGRLARVGAGKQRVMTLATASAVMGVGAIWAMHFIAMIALRMPVPVTYNVPLTALSALVAVLAAPPQPQEAAPSGDANSTGG